ncbi:NUDIX domain-containing protein [Streptomyces sp. NPDC056549]|uniref:NUDIX domain-containing protein n=1 Tax=Streptomyces sp. NPDC056549 TaxID=3345864 RepID=UPI00368C5C5E
MPEKTARSGRTYTAHYADVHLIVRRGAEILMGRRSSQPVFPHTYQVPAGLMEDHEPATMAAAREFTEETGAIVSPGDVRFVHLMHHVSTHAGSRRIAFSFEVDRWRGQIGNPEPDKCRGWQWHKATSLPEPMPPHLGIALQHNSNGATYSEYAWPPGAQAGASATASTSTTHG